MRTRSGRGFVETVLALVNDRKARTLPLRRRIAWAAAVGERALRFFPRFLRAYRQKPWIDYAWAFARGGRDEPGRRERISAGLEGLIDRAERGPYSQEYLFVGLHVLEEIAEDDGRAAQAAVEYAAMVFADAALRRLGRRPGGDDLHDRVQVPFFRFAAEALERARRWTGTRLPRGFFDDLPLDLSASPS